MIENTCIFCNTTNIIFEEEIPKDGRWQCIYCKRHYTYPSISNYFREKRKNYAKFLKQKESMKQLCRFLSEKILEANEKKDKDTLFTPKFLNKEFRCKIKKKYVFKGKGEYLL